MTSRARKQARLPRSVLYVLGTACIVMLLEAFVRRYGFLVQGQAVWWPTNGVVLAFLLRADRRNWPFLLTGSMLGSLLSQLPNHTAMDLRLVNMVGNSLAPLIAALLLPRYRDLESWMKQKWLLYRFCGTALCLAPAISAAFRASYITMVLHRPGFWPMFQKRTVADMLGYALLTPLTLLLSRVNASRNLNFASIAKRLVLMAAALAMTILIFQQNSYSIAFVLASVTALVALHLGFGASVVALNLIAIIATDRTMAGHGPFVLGSGAVLGLRILLLQAFLTLSMVTIFAVSVTQAEREWFETRLQTAYRRMEELAHLDPLTTINNRRGFEKILAVEWNRACRSQDSIAVLLVDTDHFKAYNDQFGHLAGDACLHLLAKTLVTLARRSTDVVARYGGEEFILLLPGTEIEGAITFAERVREGIAALHTQQDSCLKRAVTVSIGCAAVVPDLGSDPRRWIDEADRALYRAKQLGRNRVNVAESEPATTLPLVEIS